MNEQQATKVPPKPRTHEFFPYAFAGAVAIAVLAAWYDMQPVDGQLILADTACKAVEYHGGKVEAIAGTSLCVVRGKFRPPEHERTVQVQVDTAEGALQVGVAASAIVSVAIR